ncbi:hypothetical protein FHG87_024505 [Trinorchestia longiramus]|nr:hypothetical protein FHG87_024505 [Trinorchestia longiramus]
MKDANYYEILISDAQQKQVLDYKQANFEQIKEELGSINYEVLMRNKNAEKCYMILKEKIGTTTEYHIETKRISPTKNPPWFLKEINHVINARQQSYRRLNRCQTEPYRQKHICTCRAVKRTIKSTKRNKEIIVAEQVKTNTKSFYKCANDRRLKRNTIGLLTRTDNKIKARILNTYFTSVFTHKDLTEIPQHSDLNPWEILPDGVYTVEQVEQLSILNPYKPTGPDGFAPRILKETTVIISEPLAKIFTRSLETGIVPEDWKQANLTPISKKGNKQTPNNYRPISLTSFMSKTIERLLKVCIAEQLNDQNLMTDTQHGFRKNVAASQTVLAFFGEVNRIYHRTKAVDLINVDF